MPVTVPERFSGTGIPERPDFEYIRHGTQTLIANFEVATGLVLTPTVGQTRTEQDLAENIRATILTDRQTQWVFVMNQPNTHESKALVDLVAEQCQVPDDLGERVSRTFLSPCPLARPS